jgi:hypothetical protein
MRHLAAKVPEDLWGEFEARAAAADPAPSRKIARTLANGVRADDGDDLAHAVTGFMADVEAWIAHLGLPPPGDANDESAGAAVRGGAPASEDHPRCVR